MNARNKMKLLVDEKRRDTDDDIRVGEKVWLNLEGIELNRFNLRPCPTTARDALRQYESKFPIQDDEKTRPKKKKMRK
eukprot:SAG31_NODE_6369_length_2041_cov_8.698764_1_plen_78_part_00